MNVKCISVLIALVCVITAGSVQTAIGAQFDSTLDPNEVLSARDLEYLYQKAQFSYIALFCSNSAAIVPWS